VTNVDELDHSDDLDEMEFQVAKSNLSTSPSSLQGMCDILETLLQIESTPVGLQTERTLIGAINRVEILGRTGKLPVAYVVAAIHHMFGVLHIKYQPLWNAAVRAIVAAASSHEIVAWPLLYAELDQVMQPSFFGNDCISNLGIESVHEENEMFGYHTSLMKWEISCGENAEIFQEQVNAAKTAGKVSRHQSTDRVTVFEQVWSVMQKIPTLTTKKSRFIVPLFLRFLRDEYFAFHDDDPDAREFKLLDHIESDMGR
jgi:hypothetical protein